LYIPIAVLGRVILFEDYSISLETALLEQHDCIAP
jgi:hypothetical protein